jgi:hypothetical protein
MKMLILTYSGAEPARASALLEEAGVPGHTCFEGGRGPGDVTMCFSVVEDVLAATAATHCRAAQLPPGERLHVAVMPVDSFF